MDHQFKPGDVVQVTGGPYFTGLFGVYDGAAHSGCAMVTFDDSFLKPGSATYEGSVNHSYLAPYDGDVRIKARKLLRKGA